MIEIIECIHPTLAPLTQNSAEISVWNRPLRELLGETLKVLSGNVRWKSDFFPSDALLAQLAGESDFSVETADAEVVASAGKGTEIFVADGLRVRFPWDVPALHEKLTAALEKDSVEGEISPRAEICGRIVLGKGSRILPGVYIEGNAVIGSDCKIGPNCYIRGNTVIGDGVHIGQAVEIKNSVIGAHSAVGHLSYVGDSVLDEKVNFGAGTIIGNLRHDGRNHRSMAGGVLVDTGRRKFGAVIGRGVHTGINTSIYPGRKISAGQSTLPCGIVSRDL
ncbi:MAG: hypothetical protein MJ016_03425 [Victivallaceae bacterium]|nr:hypothetical protein [Victivallaceae bacterium]